MAKQAPSDLPIIIGTVLVYSKRGLKLKKIGKNNFALACLLIFIGLFSSFEFFSYMVLSSDEKKIPASKLLSINQNQYIADYSIRSGCTWVESVIGHPMLGFVHRDPQYMSSACRKNNIVNNIGVQSLRDLPLKKNKNEYSVLVLGGSVAHQLSEYKKTDGSLYLEALLNNLFYSPNGKKFTIYLGAVGAWSMPNQINMLLMYGERIDAVIALDGYNEASSVQGGIRLERVPAATYIIANSSYTGFKYFYLRSLLTYQKLITNTWLKYSYFFNLTYKAMSGFFQQVIISSSAIDEFERGNSEHLHLPLKDAQAWSLESLGRYIIKFHEIGKISGIKTAEFLQPTRLYGKELTSTEKSFHEFVQKSAYLKIEGLYLNLAKKNYPIKSLTNIFKDEHDEIYGDHIHFKKTDDGTSRGNELIAKKIAFHLGNLWKLKNK